MEKFLWEPSGKRKKESLLEDFSKYINKKTNYNFKNLWKWSVDHPEEFWSKFWDYSKIIGDKGKEIITNGIGGQPELSVLGDILFDILIILL